MSKPKPWDRFGSLTIDLRPLNVRGMTLQVTRIPAFTVVDGNLVFPPFSVDEALEFGEARGLALPTAEVLDAMRAASWWHAPITTGYDTKGDMQSDAIVKGHGRQWQLAFDNGGYNGDDFVANVTKAWIADAKVFEKPGFGINRGYWLSEKDAEPVQKRGQAHPSTYRDVAQGGIFVKKTPEYIKAIESGAFGNVPFSYEKFIQATRGGASTSPDSPSKSPDSPSKDQGFVDAVVGAAQRFGAWFAGLFGGGGKFPPDVPSVNPKSAAEHRGEWPMTRAALLKALGREPSDFEAQYTQAILKLEGSFGKGWKGPQRAGDGDMRQSFNKGAVQCAPSESDDKCTWYEDGHADGTRYRVRFRKYASSQEGSDDAVRHVVKKRPRTLNALSGPGATAFRASLAMRRERYYEGFCPNATKRHGGAAVRGSLSNPDKDQATRDCQEEAVTAHAKLAQGIAKDVAGALGHKHALPLGTYEDALDWYYRTYSDAKDPRK